MKIRIKEVVYIMMIITGLLIEKYGIPGANPQLEKYFGWGSASLGSINMVMSYIKGKKKS